MTQVYHKTNSRAGKHLTNGERIKIESYNDATLVSWPHFNQVLTIVLKRMCIMKHNKNGNHYDDDFHKMNVGYCFRRQITTELVIKALENAYHTQKPDDGLIFHSDLGTPYTNDDFKEI